MSHRRYALSNHATSDLEVCPFTVFIWIDCRLSFIDFVPPPPLLRIDCLEGGSCLDDEDSAMSSTTEDTRRQDIDNSGEQFIATVIRQLDVSSNSHEFNLKRYKVAEIEQRPIEKSTVCGCVLRGLLYNFVWWNDRCVP